jgi:hypothetical protein
MKRPTSPVKQSLLGRPRIVTANFDDVQVAVNARWSKLFTIDLG